jgi:hypothetical protein
MKSGPTAEREPSQKRIMALTSALFCAIIIAPSLDHRFGWSSAPIFAVLLGDCLVILGFAVILRVLRENSLASAIIEVSAGQKVVSTGLTPSSGIPCTPAPCRSLPEFRSRSDRGGASCRSRFYWAPSSGDCSRRSAISRAILRAMTNIAAKCDGDWRRESASFYRAKRRAIAIIGK